MTEKITIKNIEKIDQERDDDVLIFRAELSDGSALETDAKSESDAKTQFEKDLLVYIESKSIES